LLGVRKNLLGNVYDIRELEYGLSHIDNCSAEKLLV
jgi:hypothetical protein